MTGSNSRFLSTDVITEFRGRGDEIYVFPLSFSEFMQAYWLLDESPKIAATFQSKLKSKISINTIRQYLRYLEDAFLIHEASRYDVKGRARRKSITSRMSACAMRALASDKWRKRI